MGKVKNKLGVGQSVEAPAPPAGQSKPPTFKVIVPKGQVKLTEEELDREEDIEYSEPDEKEDTVQRYYNVRKQKICKQRGTFQVLLELSPSVVFEHKTYRTKSDPEVAVTYFREKQKLPTLGEEMISEEKKEEDEEEERRDNQDDDSDKLEEEIEEWVDSSSDSTVIVEKVEDIEEQPVEYEEVDEELAVGEEELCEDDNLSQPGTSWQGEDEDETSQVHEAETMTEMLDLEEEENENMSENSSVEEKETPMKHEKTMFNFREDATDMKARLMDTYCAIQTDVPDIIHVGGRFCMASTYDAYVAFEKKVKNASGKITGVMEEFEKMFEESAKGDAPGEGEAELVIDFEKIKIGRHDVKDDSGEESGEDRHPDDDYLIDDSMSSDEMLDFESGGDLSSSSEEEVDDKVEVEEDETHKKEEEKDKDVKKVSKEDIDGFDLLPDDFFSEDKGDTKKSESVETIDEKQKPKRKYEKEGEKLKTILTSAQKEQILNHLLNPFEYEAVVLTKDDDRDVNLNGPASDDDPEDSGEYLLAKYGTDARALFSDSKLEVEQETKTETERVNEGEQESPENLIIIEHTQKLLEKYKYLKDLKKSGGIIIEKQYKKCRGITKAMIGKVAQLLAEKEQIKGSKTQLKQVRLMRKLTLKRQVRDGYKYPLKITHERIPKQRKVTIVESPYVKEERVYSRYVQEYKRLIIANRLIHQKQFFNIGWDFNEFEDNEDRERSLYPLKKFPFLGSKDFRLTHIGFARNLKHKLFLSYESEFCASNSQWHEGYVVNYHPLANSLDFDHVPSFSSGVRYFDIAFEWTNSALMLVGLEDGSIQMLKIPFSTIIRSTTPSTKHASPVVQVMWLKDWKGKEKLDGKGQRLPNVRFQRFLSYAEDGLLKFWLCRPHVGFTVYRTVRIDVKSPLAELTSQCKKITCVGVDYHDRSLLYIGCEDGRIYKYDPRYPSNIFLCELNAHRGSVTDIAVNHFNRDVFLSGGEDGMVKLWRGNGATPVWGYWLANPIASLKWSPFLAYVWAVVTRDNFVHVYNIERHCHQPVTSQQVLDHSSCVRVEFHPVHQLLLIADNLCNVFAFKISRLATEPEVVKEELDWETKKPKDDEEEEEDFFISQRKRLKKALDRNEILVKSCARINRGGLIEQQVKEAMASNRQLTK